MNDCTITTVNSEAERKELDALLWQVLWQPLGLPRSIRKSFEVNGECIEIAAKDGGSLIGGLVANWTSPTEVELRHLAVRPQAQHQGVGSQLIKALVRIVAERSCVRIYTIARDSSAGFFRKRGFATVPGDAPEHPVFKKHGIKFELMQMSIEPPSGHVRT